MQDEKVYFYATRGPDGEFASLAAMVVGDGSSTWRWIPNFGEWVGDDDVGWELSDYRDARDFEEVSVETARGLVCSLSHYDDHRYGMILRNFELEPRRRSNAELGLDVAGLPSFLPDESLEGRAHRPVFGPALVETARRLATQAHGEQKDKAGNPYIDHPRRVAERLEAAGASAQAVAAGWLHDVLEDTPTTAADLVAVGIPAEVIDAITAVTKRPGEPTEDYAARIRASALGLQVKEADLADNCDPARMALLDENTRERLTSKYLRMRTLLHPESAPRKS